MPALTREKQLNSDFWLAFISRGMIEQYLKAFGVLYKNENSETAVVNSLSKAITSNSKWVPIDSCRLVRTQGQTQEEES